MQAYGEHEQQQQAAHGSPVGQQQLPAACKGPQGAYPHIPQICKVDAACLLTADMLPAGPREEYAAAAGATPTFSQGKEPHSSAQKPRRPRVLAGWTGRRGHLGPGQPGRAQRSMRSQANRRRRGGSGRRHISQPQGVLSLHAEVAGLFLTHATVSYRSSTGGVFRSAGSQIWRQECCLRATLCSVVSTQATCCTGHDTQSESIDMMRMHRYPV